MSMSPLDTQTVFIRTSSLNTQTVFIRVRPHIDRTWPIRSATNDLATGTNTFGDTNAPAVGGITAQRGSQATLLSANSNKYNATFLNQIVVIYLLSKNAAHVSGHHSPCHGTMYWAAACVIFP